MDSQYNNYIEGSYLASLFFSGEHKKLMARIKTLLKDDYTFCSPLRFFACTLVREKIFDSAFAKALEKKYAACLDDDSEQKKYLSIDLYALHGCSENEQKLQEWKAAALNYIRGTEIAPTN